MVTINGISTGAGARTRRLLLSSDSNSDSGIAVDFSISMPSITSGTKLVQSNSLSMAVLNEELVRGGVAAIRQMTSSPLLRTSLPADQTPDEVLKCGAGLETAFLGGFEFEGVSQSQMANASVRHYVAAAVAAASPAVRLVSNASTCRNTTQAPLQIALRLVPRIVIGRGQLGGFCVPASAHKPGERADGAGGIACEGRRC